MYNDVKSVKQSLGISHRKEPLERFTYNWEDNIKQNLDTEACGLNCIGSGRAYWPANILLNDAASN
jgi:hypothetical protein